MKTCSCCHKVYDAKGWLSLSFVGVQDLGFAKLQLRNCACGTTLAVTEDA